MKLLSNPTSERIQFSVVSKIFTPVHRRGILAAAVFALLSLAGISRAASVTLAWDAVTNSMLSGYRVYCGTTSQNYSTNFDAGPATEFSLSGLSNGVTYYFVATAYTAIGLESPPSTEIIYTVPAATNPAPAIALTSPTNSTALSAPCSISLTASVTTNGHAINKVQFYNGATILGEDATAPYGISWTNVSSGTYVVSARVVYDATNTLASSGATIMVSPSALRIAMAMLPGKVVRLSGSGTIGKTYDVMMTQDLKTWAVMTNVTMNAQGTFTLTDSGAAAQRFYRLRGTLP